MCFFLQCNFPDSAGFLLVPVLLAKALAIVWFLTKPQLENRFNLSCCVNHDCAIFKYFPPIIIRTNQGLSVLPVSENVEYSVG